MAIKTGMKPVHPGEFIRQAILPDDLTVTDAAKILGVGRPELSTLLNGKASLSPEIDIPRQFNHCFLNSRKTRPATTIMTDPTTKITARAIMSLWE